MSLFNTDKEDLAGIQSELGLINGFLQEMAMAQSKRFDAIGRQIAVLESRLSQMEEIAKTLETLVSSVAGLQQVSAPVIAEKNTMDEKNGDKPAEEITVQNATGFPVLYYGSPDGAGFEAADNLPGREDARALYAVERISDTEARFYPLQERFHRLRSNASAFFLPLCRINGDMESAASIAADPSAYGRLRLSDGYWALIEKCTVDCI